MPLSPPDPRRVAAVGGSLAAWGGRPRESGTTLKQGRGDGIRLEVATAGVGE